LQNGIIIMNC
jgi:hypothetical protein